MRLIEDKYLDWESVLTLKNTLIIIAQDHSKGCFFFFKPECFTVAVQGNTESGRYVSCAFTVTPTYNRNTQYGSFNWGGYPKSVQEAWAWINVAGRVTLHITGDFTVLYSTSSGCLLLHPGWSPPARQRATEWDGRDGMDKIHFSQLSWNLPWQNRSECTCQTPCCALDCRTQRRGLLPNPEEKKAKSYR